jgi:hypothetical protein
MWWRNLDQIYVKWQRKWGSLPNTLQFGWGFPPWVFNQAEKKNYMQFLFYNTMLSSFPKCNSHYETTFPFQRLIFTMGLSSRHIYFLFFGYQCCPIYKPNFPLIITPLHSINTNTHCISLFPSCPVTQFLTSRTKQQLLAGKKLPRGTISPLWLFSILCFPPYSLL